MVRTNINAGYPAQLRHARHVPAMRRRPMHHQQMQNTTGKFTPHLLS